MKIIVTDNETPWSDKTLTRLVRAALRSYDGKKVGERRINVAVREIDGDTPLVGSQRGGVHILKLDLPKATPLRQLANASRRRARLDPGTALLAMQLISTYYYGSGYVRDQRYPKVAPVVEARAKPRARARYDDTPVGRAQAQVDSAETRVKKYRSLLDRAERDLRKRQGVLKRMEQKFAPKRYGPSFKMG